MNLPLCNTGITGEWIGMNRDGLICEAQDGATRFRKPGFATEETFFHKESGGALRRIGLAGGRLVEIVAPFGWAGLGTAVRLMRAGETIEPWRIALFTQCGDLVIETAPVLADPAEVVCECRGLTRGEIAALAPTCPDRGALGRACGAGTVCGGCGPRLDEIVGDSTMLDAELLSIERLGPDVARLRFRYFPDVSVADEPGAFVDVQAIVEGRRLSRPYTIVATTHDGGIDIIVKRDPAGVFSRWLHDHATKASPFRLSLPRTSRKAPLRGKVAFIAAGVGITPAFLEMSANGPDELAIHWSVRKPAAALVALVAATAAAAGCDLQVHDTGSGPRETDWPAVCPPGCADDVVLCGPSAFQEAVTESLAAAGWPLASIHIESFGGRRGPAPVLRHVDSFDYLQAPVVASSFHLAPVVSVRDEAHAFLRQFYYEHGAPAAFEARWQAVEAAIVATGTYWQTYEELAFGARLAWRNSARCIGRFFWKSLQVRDLRHLDREESIFAAIVSHLETATNGGDIQPIISVFRPGAPALRIVNPQLILYAGYPQPDGSVLGDPKNVELTRRALDLGWAAPRTRFDILPIMIQVGDATPKLFELPKSATLEVRLSHPRAPAFEDLGLRWFAVPAVSGMALDVGGIQYTAAPSNGFYMGTEIGSGNFADPSRYDELARVADAMGYDTSIAEPLWRDQAMLDLNVAVLHSFARAGVRILDHHTLSAFFVRFREAEAAAKRPSYGHWAWVMPPMGGNLSPIWRDNTLQKKILKPNYFYQQLPASPDMLLAAAE